MTVAVAGWLLFVNVLTYHLFDDDKRRAPDGARRISEETLLR